MLELKNIKKDYVTGDTTVQALKGVSLMFRPNEFVSILGQSGCGKTTMLNIVGGLDSYTSGDLVIRGQSTKDFKDTNWDAYRNNDIGFVFQSYNLISHQTVLGNVELALTLSGTSKAKRRELAITALEKVGLHDQINKKPNQLSGGQMQRVAIARAIVNNPTIVLADEPTGALDSATSVQIMDLLKEIAQDRLIIMVTHNAQLAEEYSTRIISLKDGEVLNDTNPFNPSEQERQQMIRDHEIAEHGEVLSESILSQKTLINGDFDSESTKYASETGVLSDKEISSLQKKALKEREKKQKAKLKKTSMNFLTALGLSGKNLLTKKGRTFLISLAASIGIIGIALVLALSNGFQGYINNLQAETLSSVPITVQMEYLDLESIMSDMQSSGSAGFDSDDSLEKYPENDDIIVYTKEDMTKDYMQINMITQDYIDYLDDFSREKVIDIQYSYSAQHNLITSDGSTVYTGASSSIIPAPQLQNSGVFQELINNEPFVKTQYDILTGSYPQVRSDGVVEVALIVDEYNRIEKDTAESLGLSLDNGTYSFDDFIGLNYLILSNDNYYESYEGSVVEMVDMTYPDQTGNMVTIKAPSVTTKTLFVPKSEADLKTAFANPTADDLKVEVVGVMRLNSDAMIDIYNTGLVYLPSVTQDLINLNADSAVVKAQLAEIESGFNGYSIVSSQEVVEDSYDDEVLELIQALDIYEAKYLAGSIDYDTYAYIQYYMSMNVNVIPDALTFAQSLSLSLISSFEGMTDDDGNEINISATILNMLFSDFDNMMSNENYSDIADYKSMFEGYLNGAQLDALNYVNASNVPASISIYPLDFETKAELTAYLDAYNDTVEDGYEIYYTDSLSMLTESMGTLIDIISYVLIAFAAVSLVVSSIMIAIITYVSVIERTKEIGVLRSIGARKKDISRVFNAETVIIGCSAGILGVAISYLLTIPINLILTVIISANSGP